MIKAKHKKSIEMDEIALESKEVKNKNKSEIIKNNTDAGLFKRLFKKEEHIPRKRKININGGVSPACNLKNNIKNQKYTPFNFLPIILFNQFKYFFNLFFLFICISQFIPIFKVGLLFSTLSPLLFVLFLTIIKEVYEDYNKYKRDKEINEYKYHKYDKGKFTEIMSKDIKVGDIIEIKANQRIPVDCIFLYTEEESESVFVRTDQLDGETDWKLKLPIINIQKYYKQNKKFIGNFKIEEANKKIYEFKSIYKNENEVFPVNIQNTMWTSMVLCNGRCLCMAIYVGKETKISMNLQEQRIKIGEFDLEINKFSKMLFCIMMGLATLLALMSTTNVNIFVQIFRYVLLMSSIIPISLRVSLDFSKLYFSYMITNDKDIPGTIARNSLIPEELGRIEFIMSDKTGTLTQNEMSFKLLKSQYLDFGEKNINEYKELLYKELTIIKKDNLSMLSNATSNSKNINKFSKEYKTKVLKEIAFSIALSHNVTPSYDSETNEKSYIASSPDEIALVKLSENIGLELIERDQSKIIIKLNASNKNITKPILYEYEILNNFPFTSESKRMGIILRNKSTNEITFYLKGADSVIKNKISKIHKEYMLDETENLSREGLRTLAYCKKSLTEEEYTEFSKTYIKLQCDPDHNLAGRYLEDLEKNMEFTCVTAVEDKLQDDVARVIESLKLANIRFWMLTGDKIETAMCIAISTSIKSLNQHFFIIKEIHSGNQLLEKLSELNSHPAKNTLVLIIDGESLTVALETNEALFFDLAFELSSVVICRCSPIQKAIVTAKIKIFSGKKVLGIGDGGNDVGMIWEADVGIGIEGKEGKQAALASDFSIKQFKNIMDLLFWHGRNCYKRTSIMALFVIHRGVIISIMQFMFCCMFYYVTIPFFNGLLMLGYSTIYTMLPVFSLIIDYDLGKEFVFEFTTLYTSMQKGREFYLKIFLIWLWKSIFQGFIIVLLAFYWFNTPFLNLVTICFTALIFTEYLNIFGEIKNFNKYNLICLLFSIVVYILSIYLFNNYLNINFAGFEVIFKSILISIICYFPFVIIKYYTYKMFPTEEQKIMKKIKLKLPWWFKIINMFKKIFKKNNKDTEIKSKLLNL